IFKVVATNALGDSATPASSNAVTPATPPSQPQSVTASAGNLQATVNWQAPTSNGGASITSYTVTPYIGNTAQPGWTVNPTPTTFVATGLTNGTTYTFRVYASNSAGPGPSATSNAVEVGLPAAPTGVSATAGANQATVSWTASVSNGATITSYIVQSFVGAQKQNASA